MADRLEIAKAKELRGDIIERLYSFFGEEVAIGTLRNLLRYKSYNSEKEITKAVDYLSGRGKEYIEVKRLGSDDGNYWDSIVRLTPTGVNLAEGDIEDMGVTLNE